MSVVEQPPIQLIGGDDRGLAPGLSSRSPRLHPGFMAAMMGGFSHPDYACQPVGMVLVPECVLLQRGSGGSSQADGSACRLREEEAKRTGEEWPERRTWDRWEVGGGYRIESYQYI